MPEVKSGYLPWAQRLRTIRLSQGLSIKTVAQLVGCAFNTWYNWERGRTRPDLTRAGAIAAALNVPVAALFTDELVVAEIVVSQDTVRRIRSEGRGACQDVAERLASRLEPVLWAAVTKPPADIRPGARPKPRRTRAETLAQLNARPKRTTRSID
jgi:transcriptional regulator with XRE-family HTH domain